MNKVTIYYYRQKDVTIQTHSNDVIVINEKLNPNEFIDEGNIKVFASLIKRSGMSYRKLLGIVGIEPKQYTQHKSVQADVSVEDVLQMKYGMFVMKHTKEDYLKGIHPSIIATRNSIPISNVKKLIKYWDSLPSRKDNVESNK